MEKFGGLIEPALLAASIAAYYEKKLGLNISRYNVVEVYKMDFIATSIIRLRILVAAAGTFESEIRHLLYL